MKAKESIDKYPARLREYTNYTVRSIKNTCKQIGPRTPGSDEEKKAQEIMKKDLEKCCDETKREEFKLSAHAFMSWVIIGAALMIIAVILLNLGYAAVSLGVGAVAIFIILGEFLLYKQILDPFFKKSVSGNVTGVRKSSGETKKRIVFLGHSDSSFEWTYTYHGGSKVVTSIVVLSLIGIVYTIALSAVNAAKGYAMTRPDSAALQILGYTTAVFCVVYIAALFFCNYKSTVMGANDDLTGCFSSVAVLKFLEDNDIRFENTEVMAIITGGEECGLRGTKEFCKKYASQLKSDGVETVFVALDTLRDMEFISLAIRDMTGTVKNSKKAAAMVQAAAKNADIEIPFGTIPLGATDAAALSQAGLEAVALTAMDPAPARYYHTRLDTEDNLNIKTIENCLNVALETVFFFDEHGLKENY